MGDGGCGKCCKIIIITAIVMAVVLGLILYFFIPRVPEVDEDGTEITDLRVNESPPLLEFTTTTTIVVKSRNWVDIKVNTVNLDIFSSSGRQIGTVDDSSGHTIRKRTTSRIVVEGSVSTSDPAAVAEVSSQLATGGATLRYVGIVGLSYLSIEKDFDLDFEAEAEA